MPLDARVALITGAAGGIGSAIARELAADGAYVCLADCSATDALAAELRSMGRQAHAVRMDVTRGAEVRAAVDATVATLGRLDILVNVAGIASFGAAQSITEEEWDRVHAINLRGTFLCCQAAIGPMRGQRYGRIINIGSILAKNGGNARPWIDPGEQEHAANAAYGASKAGVHALTLYLAKELARDGITVNAVAPGPVASAMTSAFPERLRALIPAGRMGTAAEVAHACVFIAQESSAFITGEILDVNGGMWMD